MSGVDALIHRLCPDGVGYRALGEAGEVFRGRRFTKTDYVEDGLAAIHYGELYTHYGTSATDVVTRVRAELEPNLRFVEPGDVVIAEVGETLEDVGKAVAWLGSERVAIHDGCYGFRSALDPTFVSYYLQTAAFHADKNRHVARAKVKRLSIQGLRQIRIPVPPIEVQREIVRVLDLFQSLEAELEAQLEAELEARRRQYAHYRDVLLTFADAERERDLRWVTLADVCCSVSSGGTPLATRADFYGGTIPWLRTQEVVFNEIVDTEVKITELGLALSSAKWIPRNCVIVAISGATAARAAINKIPLTTNQHCCNLEIDSTVADYRYVFHWVSREYARMKAMGRGARADLNAAIIKGYPIALPSLAEQERIVAILDGFEALVNDLSVALPAELTARRRQYQHCRDRLLTFDEAA